MPDSLTLLYLHGFLSSPASKKAQQTHDFALSENLAETIIIPEIRTGPADTIRDLELTLQAHDLKTVGIIGSSLGGFYATVLAERLGLPAVLINPAVSPHQYWQSYLGEHQNYHSGEPYEVTAEHVNELRELDPTVIVEPQKYCVFLQQHDEVLDYRQALARYEPQHCVVREDGDHAYENFIAELPQSFDFLLSRIGRFVR